jgi:putative ABC transport system permease protein
MHLELKGLSAELGDLQHQGLILAVDQLSIHPKEKIAIYGASGLGKSSLLKILAGLEGEHIQITYESLVVDHPIHPQDRFAIFEKLRNHQIAYVAQDFALIDHLSVLDHLSLHAQLQGRSLSPQEKQRQSEILGILELIGFENRAPKTLSQGEQQRVAIARAVMQNPQILLLDEPSAHLDPFMSKKLLDLLMSLPCAVVMISHDPTLVSVFPKQWTLKQKIQDQCRYVQLEQLEQISSNAEKPSVQILDNQNQILENQDQTSSLSILFKRFYAIFHYLLNALSYYRKRYILLIFAMVLVLSLFATIHQIMHFYEQQLDDRAKQTPLVLGKIGSRYDLVLNTLYYQGEPIPTIPQIVLDEVMAENLGVAVPIYIKWTVYQSPLIATNFDYFEQRKMTLQAGSWPSLNGEVVVGEAFAQKHRLNVGDWVYSDQQNLYELAAAYPLKMKITGILKPHHPKQVDDFAVFCDLKTAWIIQGLAHGHQKVEGSADASILTYQEINKTNIDDFHFHGEWEQLPISALLIFSESAKDQTLLKSKYQINTSYQIQSPQKVIWELLTMVFQFKKLLDVILSILAMMILLLVIIVLRMSFQQRQKERQTLMELGMNRPFIRKLIGYEIFALISFTLLFVLAFAWLVQHYFLLAIFNGIQLNL